MSNIENIIADIKEVNCTHDFWIRDKNGDIKDDVICGDVIPFLEELKEYEIDMTQDEIIEMINIWDETYDPHISHFNNANYWRDNTYNCNANIDHDIDYRILALDNDDAWFVFMVHRFGDVRGNYTDYAVCKFSDSFDVFQLDFVTQFKNLDDGNKIQRYTADINIFNEGYYVYDNDEGEDIGYYYDIKLEDLLKSIAEYKKEKENCNG